MPGNPTAPLPDGSHKRYQEYIQITKLFVDDRWQRGYDEAWSKWLAENWSDDDCDLLDVAELGERFSVIDGQHRLAAAAGCGITELPCWVYVGLTAEQMAHLFEAKNRNRRPVDPVSMFKNQVFQGKHAQLEVKSIVETAGLVIPTRKSKQKDGQVVAIGALMHVYRTYGAIHLRQTLRVLMGAWDQDCTAFQAVPIKGTALFLSRYRDQFDEKHLIERLKGHAPGQIKRNATNLADITTANADTAWAQTILAIYNYDLRTRKLSEWVGKVRVAKPRIGGHTEYTGIRRAIGLTDPNEKAAGA